jgi:hypothetical protein
MMNAPFVKPASLTMNYDFLYLLDYTEIFLPNP